mgnify:CR=1 FL=1
MGVIGTSGTDDTTATAVEETGLAAYALIGTGPGSGASHIYGSTFLLSSLRPTWPAPDGTFAANGEIRLGSNQLSRL